MTEQMFRSVARLPGGLLARPGAAFAFALVQAYLGGMWMQFLHRAEGGHERNEPGFLLHWLRDGTLSLPLVLLLVWLGLAVARRLIGDRAESDRRLALMVCAACVGLAAGLSAAIGGPAHGALFQASHGGHELPLLLHAGRDTLLSLAVSLPLAAITALALARRTPWAAPDTSRWRLPITRVPRLAVRGAVALVVIVPCALVASNTAQTATAALAAGAPCPDDAAVKRFEVQAIDVDIPLNRFGDHDSQGKMYVLKDRVDAVRAQEASRRVQLGLRDDAIQPLVIRANLGDCVEIDFTNGASGGEYGMHIDGVAFQAASSGDAVGNNASSAVARGATRTYRYWIPNDPELEGTHYIRPGPGNRQAISHGLFGALAVQPAGSTYAHPDTGAPLRSGWEAIVKPANGKAFREYVKIYHEIGDEDYKIPAAGGRTLDVVDPITEAYRPGSRAINYRSEPFMHRLERSRKKSLAYNSYTFGDPATPIMRAYVGDPSKVRAMHAGGETFHVYHLHGGGIRWRYNPRADASFSYQKTGLDKHPPESRAQRLDSQSIGPGESYTFEIEGGAGGVQQAVGDLLEHCHIAEHYVAGMWSFWRVFNTRQPDLEPMPDRAAPPRPVDSSELLGRTMPDGSTLTAENLDDWIRPQVPTQGRPSDDFDASVWDWSIDRSDPAKPVYLGEPEETENWPNLPGTVPGHPSALPVDRFVGDRPRILFNPQDGRIAYPLLRPNIGQRSPHSPNGHSGAPFLGERGGVAKTGDKPSPWASRPDGICPTGTPNRRFDVTTIQLPIRVGEKGETDPTGKIFVLNKDKAAVRAGEKPAQPLAIRANVGDCVDVTLSTELEPEAGQPLPQSNMHIHHVQFDPQGSDGASAGMVYDQSVLPYREVDPRLTADVAAGDTTLALSSVAKFRPGVWIGVGLATDKVEVRQIETVDAGASTVTLVKPLERAHASGDYAGTEYVQERWYPDVQLDNVFWHDHVDGIHGWGKGLVGQLIVEPKGSTYHDPKTGDEVDSGTIVDVRTPGKLGPGVDGAFREVVLWTINDNPVTDSTINLRAAPWADRLATDADPSLLFSSHRHGDPNTPLPRAYRGDPLVVRTVNVSGNGIDTLRLDGHRFRIEGRQADADGNPVAGTTDTLHYGVSERFTAIVDGGAGGTGKRAGDYLYFNGTGRRFRQGAWGIMRVLPGRVGDLQPLPGHDPGAGTAPPSRTGGRPPQMLSSGSPCPSGARDRTFDVAAVDVPGVDAESGRSLAYVPAAQAAAVAAGQAPAEPLSLHAAVGECVTVKFTNRRTASAANPDLPRATFHVGELDKTVASAGVNVGDNPEQSVAPGKSREYKYFIDSERIGSATIADFGGLDTGSQGLYGAIVVAPQGASFADPKTGLPKDVGTQVDVKVPGGKSYRDFTLLFADDDPVIGGNTMPYPTAVDGPALINYGSSPRRDDAAAFSSRTNGDPATVLKAYAGDPVRVHAIGAPGSEQGHVLSLGGPSWSTDPHYKNTSLVSAQGFGAWEGIDAIPEGGAGGWARMRGDLFVGDLRRPFTQAGMWGLMRVLPDDPDCRELKPLPGLDCLGQDPIQPEATPVSSDPGPGSGGDSSPVVRPRVTQPAPTSTKKTTTSSPSRSGDDDASDKRPAALSGLSAPRRASIGSLGRTGLRLELNAPSSTRVLRVRLVRTVGSKRTTVATTTLKVRRGGTISARWRLERRVLRRLKPGTHQIQIQAGPGPRTINRERLDASLTLTRGR